MNLIRRPAAAVVTPERRAEGIVLRKQRSLLRAHPNVGEAVMPANFQTTDADGRVLVALDAGEMQALRQYWDIQEEVAARAARMFGRRHG